MGKVKPTTTIDLGCYLIPSRSYSSFVHSVLFQSRKNKLLFLIFGLIQSTPYTIRYKIFIVPPVAFTEAQGVILLLCRLCGISICSVFVIIIKFKTRNSSVQVNLVVYQAM